MYFQHSAPIWRDFPALVPAALYAEGITADAPTGPAADRFAAVAKSRLAAVAAESELPEIQAWRRAFAAMGLKPTQYRCASESLLRRFRREGSLPRLHPLVDLCNAVSLAYAIPVAVLDLSGHHRPARGPLRDRRRGVPDLLRGDRAPGRRRGDLRRRRRAGARPPLDEPAERPVRGAGLHDARPDRGRSAARLRARRHPRARRGPGRRDPGGLVHRAAAGGPDRLGAPVYPGSARLRAAQARAATRSEPARVNSSYSASWVGLSCPARPRYRSAMTAPRRYAPMAAVASASPTGP